LLHHASTNYPHLGTIQFLFAGKFHHHAAQNLDIVNCTKQFPLNHGYIFCFVETTSMAYTTPLQNFNEFLAMPLSLTDHKNIIFKN